MASQDLKSHFSLHFDHCALLNAVVSLATLGIPKICVDIVHTFSRHIDIYIHCVDASRHCVDMQTCLDTLTLSRHI